MPLEKEITLEIYEEFSNLSEKLKNLFLFIIYLCPLEEILDNLHFFEIFYL